MVSGIPLYTVIPWTQEEDDRLIEYVQTHSRGKAQIGWQRAIEEGLFPRRTREALTSRFYELRRLSDRATSALDERVGSAVIPWTLEEKQRLLEYAQTHQIRGKTQIGWQRAIEEGLFPDRSSRSLVSKFHELRRVGLVPLDRATNALDERVGSAAVTQGLVPLPPHATNAYDESAAFLVLDAFIASVWSEAEDDQLLQYAAIGNNTDTANWDPLVVSLYVTTRSFDECIERWNSYLKERFFYL